MAARLTAAGPACMRKHIGMARVLAVQLLRQAPGTGFIARFQQGPGAFQLVVETHRRLARLFQRVRIIRSCCGRIGPQLGPGPTAATSEWDRSSKKYCPGCTTGER